MSLVECVPSSTSPSRPVGVLAVHLSSWASLAVVCCAVVRTASSGLSTLVLLDGNLCYSL